MTGVSTPLLIEQRFPLDLDESNAAIRALYEAGKSAHWDPFRDVDWAALAALPLAPEVRQAARLAYSRRLWQEYTGLSETPALLIRFCLETGRSADPKYFLTVRNTEEAWHIECFHATAQAFGGALSEPASGRFAQVFNQRRHTAALDAKASLDAYVATHCALEDELELRLAEAALATATIPALRAMWMRIVADKRRHAEFGWLFVASRGPSWNEAEKNRVIDSIKSFVDSVVGGGYHCVTLAPAGVADEFAAAEAIIATAGLGGVGREAERAAWRTTLVFAGERLSQVGVTLPAVLTV